VERIERAIDRRTGTIREDPVSMSMRLSLLFLSFALGATLILGCESDSGMPEPPGEASMTDFRPSAALITAADLPAGFFAVESERGEGLCGFRLVDLADNGARGTFQNTGGKVVVEHLVLRFSGAAPESFSAFEETVDTCPRTSTATHQLRVRKVPIGGLDADQTLGVRIESIRGRPRVRALAIVAREGREIISVTTSRADRPPSVGTVEIARRALERLRRAKSGDL
jgi:hypothetical protein